MGQQEILEYLKKERAEGNDEFLPSCEICKALDLSYSGVVFRQLNKLLQFEYLEVKLISLMPLRRGFRVKKKYI
jgi:hypothetical protein